MKITKFGHSCLLVEEGDARILIDPGAWSDGHTALINLDAIFITHLHQDHCDPTALAVLHAANPNVSIYTNHGAGEVLDQTPLPWVLVEDGQTVDVRGVQVDILGKDHACIHDEFPIVPNTGVVIAKKFFHPGDAVDVIPPMPVDILALPVVAPWMKIADALDYAEKVKPRVSFPIHDGMLKHVGPFHMIPERVLSPKGIGWAVLEHGVGREF